MELIVISDRKFKIMLTAPDMAHYDLNPEDMTESDGRTRLAFRHLLDDCGQIGKDTRGEKLLVQVYASKGGGCEIFVTKIPDDRMEASHAADAFSLTKEERILKDRILQAGDADATCSQNEATRQRTEKVFLFKLDSLGETIGFCKRAKILGCSGGACYRLHIGDEYVLRVTLPTTECGDMLPSFWNLKEYGDEIRDPLADLYIDEHGEALLESGAVDLLAEY